MNKIKLHKHYKEKIVNKIYTHRSPSKHNWVTSWQYLFKQTRTLLKSRDCTFSRKTTQVAIAQMSTCAAIMLKSSPHILSLSKVNHNYAVRIKLAYLTAQTCPRYSNAKFIYAWTRTSREVMNPISFCSFLPQGIVFPIIRTNKNLTKNYSTMRISLKIKYTQTLYPPL